MTLSNICSITFLKLLAVSFRVLSNILSICINRRLKIILSNLLSMTKRFEPKDHNIYSKILRRICTTRNPNFKNQSKVIKNHLLIKVMYILVQIFAYNFFAPCLERFLVGSATLSRKTCIKLTLVWYLRFSMHIIKVFLLKHSRRVIEEQDGSLLISSLSHIACTYCFQILLKLAPVFQLARFQVLLNTFFYLHYSSTVCSDGTDASGSSNPLFFENILDFYVPFSQVHKSILFLFPEIGMSFAPFHGF